MKSRWGIYLTERFPVIPNLLVAAGIALSAKMVCGNRDPSKVPLAIAVIGGMFFLAQIRFMDEYKDFEKDRIAHPERPLPRGLFSLSEFGRFIRIFQVGMFLIAILAAVLIRVRAGIWFAAGTLYLFLMFREFYLKEWLGERPLLYAVTHQFIIIPMSAFVLECFSPGATGIPGFIPFSALFLFSFFGFEVGRKLDPGAHPVLNTYLQRYGREKTTFLLLLLLGLALVSSDALGIRALLGPLYVLILASVSILWWAPVKFKWIEGLVTLFLLLALWGIPLSRGFS
jgi:4-hydroxybenzoate polyprenyltransferase